MMNEKNIVKKLLHNQTSYPGQSKTQLQLNIVYILYEDGFNFPKAERGLFAWLNIRDMGCFLIMGDFQHEHSQIAAVKPLKAFYTIYGE